MIGGPNQSHKVNFKELPKQGKVSKQEFSVTPRQLFSLNLPKKIPENYFRRTENSRLQEQSLQTFAATPSWEDRRRTPFTDPSILFPKNFQKDFVQEIIGVSDVRAEPRRTRLHALPVGFGAIFLGYCAFLAHFRIIAQAREIRDCLADRITFERPAANFN